MIIRRLVNSQGQLTLKAEASGYDALPPVPDLILDHAPKIVNFERLAVASYLFFGESSGGQFVAPCHMGPATARAITRDAEPLQLLCEPLEYYPKPLSIGSRAVKLTDKLPVNNVPTIANMRSDKWNGSLRSHTSIVVPTNSFMFSRHELDIRAHLGVGVLFADDLSADVLLVNLHDKIPHEEMLRLQRLLEVVRLGLVFERQSASAEMLTQ